MESLSGRVRRCNKVLYIERGVETSFSKYVAEDYDFDQNISNDLIKI